MSAADKQALRDELKTLREEAHARDPDAGETLADKFPMKLLERYGPIVSGYLPISSEIDPRPLMGKLAKAGAKLALPRIDAGEMSFRLWQPGDALEDRAFGLSEPSEDAVRVQPTLMLVPLLGFDGAGTRIGYGKGHYDRAISDIRKDGRVFTCGLGFHAQMMDNLPVEDHDEPLDWAVTERGSVPIFMMRTFAKSGGDGPDAA
ncbi:5-formyltetrahydrofolate cyclo-ligase [Henriciella litoralis]|uniref:5-formyltetrahydrofolate cyclo-ligase n=1 Tax=Henriciella litoralis TaxID=568102 RepID=UPI000A0419E5|nr:5-formyltetrahydrofolate cyclo-ligase [Henriciella litoralis]